MKNGRFRILLVDDDVQVARVIKAWMDKEFSAIADIVSITNPQEAFGRLHEGGFQLLITDLNMPSVNGFHLLKKLKSLDPLAQALVLTGQPSKNAIRSAFEMGADEYVFKPVDRRVFVDCVKYLLGRIDRWRSDLGIDLEFSERCTTAADW